MKRREALKTTAAALAGYTFLFGGTAVTISSCKTDKSTSWVPEFLTQDQFAIVSEVAERIIPKTDTPGAKDALVDRYIDMNVKLNFTEEQQQLFTEALNIFDTKAKEKFSGDYISISDDNKDMILQELYQETQEKDDDDTPHIFDVLKQMTVFGYFTSEVGAKEFLVYDPIPGQYSGCIDVEEVGGVWAL